MRTSRLGEALSALVLTVLTAAGTVVASIEPAPEPYYRGLRSDYVKSWYVYNDSNLNGILDPGDTRMAIVNNWWTPASSGSQNNYSAGPYGANDMVYGTDDHRSSSPINRASTTSAEDNYWLPREKNAIHFYLSYSQYDNNDWATMYTGQTGLEDAVVRDRSMSRNGWHLGWVTGDQIRDADGNYTNDQTLAGTVKMDVLVHNGQATNEIGGFGINRSNPQVSISNHISAMARWHNKFEPPLFDSTAGSYNVTANAARLALQTTETPIWTTSTLQSVVDSVELREYNPYSSEVDGKAVDSARTPNQLLSDGVTDHNGSAYLYQDAFIGRNTYTDGASGGGVIAGLAGQSDYNPSLNNWGDQQVIRIDFDPSTFVTGDPIADGNITKVVFYDFGYAPGSGQISPHEIVLDLADTSLFPENRFFIATVEMIPEPTTLAAMSLGGAGWLLNRRRTKRPERT